MINRLRAQISEYFVGKEEVIEDVLICLLAGGHILLEDVPGVGKTTLAKILSRSIDLSFARIQFTPDTLPSDVVGISIYNMKTGEFEYKEGAVMPMRSTGHLRKLRPACWKLWEKERLAWMELI